MSASLAVNRLLLNAARPPCLNCDASTSAECSRLVCLTCRGLHVLPARLSLHALSSHARHWLEVRTIKCSGPCSATHCCLVWTSVFDRACTRPRPSWTSGEVTPRTHLIPSHPHSHSVDPSSHLVEHLHPLLLGHTGLP